MSKRGVRNFEKEKIKSYVILGIGIVLWIITLILGEKFYIFMCLMTPVGFSLDIRASKMKSSIVKLGVLYVVGQFLAYLNDFYYGIYIAMYAHPVSLAFFGVFLVIFVLCVLAVLLTPSGNGEKESDGKGYEVSKRENNVAGVGQGGNLANGQKVDFMA